MSLETYRDLLINAGASAGIDLVGAWETYYGGTSDFVTWGNLGNGTMQLELTPDNGTTIICITGIELYDKGVVRFNLNPGFKIRAHLSETTAASSGVYARIF